MTPPRKVAPPGRAVTPPDVQGPNEDQILQGWYTDICKRADVVDPDSELDWKALWIGYAVAKGLDAERAWRIYLRKAQPFEGRP